jgi:uncharacterized membrane protein
MTKKGYKSKFFKTIIVLSICGFLFLAYVIPEITKGGFDTFAYLIITFGLPLIVTSAVVALIWEFFSE